MIYIVSLNERNMSKNIEIVKNLEPKEVFKYFAEISDIARGSGNTNKIVEYLVNFATKNNLKYEKDNYNNVIITKGTSNKKKSTIALQAHIDMVCVKTDDCNKDMTKEGIDLVVDGDWLRADKTTLGADDGIGMAIILAVLTDKNDYEREVIGIFTDDEEVGLIGAHNVNLSDLDIKYLINIDNEEFDVIDVGCAGGTQLECERKCKLINKTGGRLLSINVDGLIGGHSGMEITKKRGNANKILAKILHDALSKVKFNLRSIDGGNFNNAIPNKSKAQIVFSEEVDENKIKEVFDKLIVEEENSHKVTEANINISFDLSINNSTIEVLSDDDTEEVLNALTELPDGLISTFKDNPDIAETSLNLGVLKTNKDVIYIEHLIRSNVNEKRESLNKEVLEIVSKYKFKKILEDSYPAWEYKKTELEDYVSNQFETFFGRKSVIEITHGGLECGILLEKMPKVEAIAIGPTILGAHTTKERLVIGTVQHIQDLVIKTLLELR